MLHKILLTLSLVMFFSLAQGQLLQYAPGILDENSSNVVITVDATKGNAGLLNYALTNDVYVHIAVLTNYSTNSKDWKYLPFVWGTTNPAAQATYSGTNKWSYTISSSLRAFFNISNSNEHIQKIAIIFRNGSGSQKMQNADGSDMFITVKDPAALNVSISLPARDPKFIPSLPERLYSPGDAVSITGVANLSGNMSVLYNNIQIASNINSTTINATTAAVAGDNTIIISSTAGSKLGYDTLKFYVAQPVITAALPAGSRAGINYVDANTVTLVLYAPNKTSAAVIGEFNNFTNLAAYQMKRTPDGTSFWITLTGLQAGREYAYQYLVDGQLKVADMFSEKILDNRKDLTISASTYPNLKKYPDGQSGIVSIFQTNQTAFNWQHPFTKADKRNLIIYELLIRDFVSEQNWQTVKDTLSYLKKLGVNAIEIMPFNQFENTQSWGYDPTYFLAPEKSYGTATALKQFIDECHKLGIAVIMDLVMNHAFGSSPTAQLYWDSVNNRPSTNSAFHNPVAKHPLNVGYDFNHEAPATKYLVDRVVEHWLTNYKIDGFRWDLAKGFTQTNYGTALTDLSAWAAYDAGRIMTWKRIYDKMQSIVPNSYCILEHFADNTEEIELSNYGMLLWGNANTMYNQATMGYMNGSDFSYGLYTSRGWSQANLVTYQESHDEERLMYKNLTYGNSNGSYDIKNLTTALKRNEMSTAFWALTPAPKMLWQFGELGYDFSINRCTDATWSEDCRTTPKPIVWNYLQDARRMALFNVYSKLFMLRNYPPYFDAWISSNLNYNLSGAFKYYQLTSAPLNITVIGNFDVVTSTGTVTFQHSGTWYDYLSDQTFNATGSAQSFTLQPGEYHVYVDRKINLSPAINSVLTATGVFNSAFMYTITATNNPTIYNATNLPTGLIINTATGVISGTPTTAASNVNVILSATNASGTDTKTLVLTINPAAPVVTSELTATAIAGNSFTYSITATNDPVSYNATNLPFGLTINTTTGQISGTVVSSGTVDITIAATNATGTDTRILTLTISTATGIADQKYANLFEVVPNPATKGNVVLRLSSLDGDGLIKIENAQGIVVYEATIVVENNVSMINLEKLTSGLYIVVFQKQNQYMIQKLIVE